MAGPLGCAMVFLGPLAAVHGSRALVRVWHHFSGARRRLLEEAARDLGCRAGASGLAGRIQGFSVSADLKALGHEYRLKVKAGRGEQGTEIPSGLQVFSRGPANRPGEIIVGDPGFDSRFSVRGDAETVFALLGAETRLILLEELAETGWFCVQDAAVSLEKDFALADGAGPIEALVGRSVRVAARLTLPWRDLAEVLLENALHDPCEEVRIRAFSTLADRHPGRPSFRKAVEGFLAATDSAAARLQAARALGADGFKTIAAIARAPSSPEEIAARALAYAARFPLQPGTPGVPLARVVPLLRHAVTGTQGRLRLAGLVAITELAGGAAREGNLESLRAAGLEEAVIAGLGTGPEREQRAAVAALGAMGTSAAVPHLRAAGELAFAWGGLRREAEKAVSDIQARLSGSAAAGQVSLADGRGASGRVCLADAARDGRVAFPPDTAERG